MPKLYVCMYVYIYKRNSVSHVQMKYEQQLDFNRSETYSILASMMRRCLTNL